jgi:hypothetical protein
VEGKNSISSFEEVLMDHQLLSCQIFGRDGNIPSMWQNKLTNSFFHVKCSQDSPTGGKHPRGFS